jgi:glyoxylase-like metal-dependent hydrolase (beta-lactamase superfamily II)/rhodanese-related sulfurtransferase
MTLETHVHADHVTGAWRMRKALGSQIALSEASGAQGADRFIRGGDTVELGETSLTVLDTPGHTAGCVSFFDANAGVVFTGDALLIRGAGRTDFQEGDAEKLFHSVRDQIFALPDATLVYPAHDYSGRNVTTVLEEKLHNPRLGSHVREEDFVGYMTHLGLPHPKKLDVAVPANLRVGEPDEGWQDSESSEGWAPVVRTYAGVLEVEPEWVRLHQSDVLVLDVREEAEVRASPLGCLADAQLEPLSSLRERLANIPKERPLITTCPSGARSAMAAGLLEKAGARRVANLRGGLLEWQQLGYPLEKLDI